MVQLSDAQVDIILNRIAADGTMNVGLQNGLLDHYCCFIEESMNRGIDFETAYNEAFQAITPNGMYEIQEELFFLLTFKKQTNMKRITYGLGFLASFCISSGLLFKLMHWPGSTPLMLIGFAALIVTSIVLLANSMKHLKSRRTAATTRTFMGFAAAILISSGSIFKIQHFPGASIQFVLGMILLNLVFLPMLFFHLYQQAVLNSSNT
jgi:hypothetical protein